MTLSSLSSGSVLLTSAPSLWSCFFTSTFSSALSFFPRRPPKILPRFPRDTDRDLAFLAFFASSEELLEDDPPRAGAATMASSVAVAGVSVLANAGVASVLFLGAACEVEAVAAANAVGLPA